MGPLFCAAFVLCLPQDRQVTHGKSNTQILAMGRSGWYNFYTKLEGDSTAGMSSAEGLYGDALAWRNDRLRKPGTAWLRKMLQDTNNDAIGVGSSITGGGTMWNITSSSLYATAEETLYKLLTKTGKPAKRVVSDVNKAYAGLQKALAASDSPPEYSKTGREALARLRKDLDRVLAEAKRLPRRESDVLLNFCLDAIAAATNS